MSEPMLLDDLQLEETDTIYEVESSDDSAFEVVQAPVNDEEPEQPKMCCCCARATKRVLPFGRLVLSLLGGLTFGGVLLLGRGLTFGGEVYLNLSRHLPQLGRVTYLNLVM